MPDGKTRIARTGTDSHKFKPSRFAKASVFAKATPDETPDRSQDRQIGADGHRFLTKGNDGRGCQGRRLAEIDGGTWGVA
jgi:hypothetical protein